MKNSKGLTLVELLIATAISTIILLALTSLFIVGNRTFKSNKEVSDITDDVRNAITTLDFLFSRWGVGVPCPSGGCNLQSPPPNCTSYPPSDPMCITINTNEVIFYGNIYGLGFVTSLSSGNANIVSCRLSSNKAQNCYYVWNGGNLKGGYYTSGTPKYYSFSTFSGSPDCITSNSVNLTVSGSLTEQISQNPQTLTVDSGDYITRVPHRIRIYLSNNAIYFDRTDMAPLCNDNENAVLIASAESFSAQKSGRSVRLDITFRDSTGKRFTITRYYGR